MLEEVTVRISHILVGFDILKALKMSLYWRKCEK